MSYNQKDLLQFALDLYQKTKENGLVNYWNKEVMESLMDALKKINPSELLATAGTGGERKQQAPLQQNLQTGGDDIFWQEEAAPLPKRTAGSGLEADMVSPVSIYETARDVNIQAILPGIVAGENLHVLLTRETLELYGDRSDPARGNQAGSFHKTIRLPAMVEPAQATAAYHNGLLSLRAPKKKLDPPLKIAVKFE